MDELSVETPHRLTVPGAVPAGRRSSRGSTSRLNKYFTWEERLDACAVASPLCASVGQYEDR